MIYGFDIISVTRIQDNSSYRIFIELFESIVRLYFTVITFHHFSLFFTNPWQHLIHQTT